MRLTFLLSIALFALSCKSNKLLTLDPADANLRKDVGTLASDMMMGRETGTEGEKMAAAFLGSRMRTMGLTPKGDGSSFLQNYKRKVKTNPHADHAAEDDPVISGNNVVGYYDAGAPYTIVVGAHYDHLGMGSFGSLHAGPPQIHNGADDNASGVAVMLGIAESVIAKKNKGYNYLFIAFSGEEKGLWGSKYYATHPTIDLDKVTFMINMDMVGRLNEERQLAIMGTGTSPIWDGIIDGIEKPIFKIKKDESGIGPSDHTSFYLEDIPVLHFFTGQHEHYHKPEDDVEHINFAGMQDVGNFILEIIHRTNYKEKVPFTKTKEKKEDTPDFKVTLGVMPDYLYDGVGMRIDGVREGRPASNAGMQRGDIVLQIEEHKVVDMMAYMKCLGIYSPGDTVKIIIKRGDEELEKEVTF